MRIDDMDEQVGDATIIEYHQDEDGPNPRTDYDNVGVIVDWHRREEIGDRKPSEHEEQALKRGGFPLLRRYMRRYEDMAVLLPVSLLDHSGLHIWVGGGAHWSDAAGWDSGTVGFIYCTREQVKAEWAGDLEQAERYLEQEIETYDSYLKGECYGYVVKLNGEVVDSCWGFLGDIKYCREEARASAKLYEEEYQQGQRLIEQAWALV